MAFDHGREDGDDSLDGRFMQARIRIGELSDDMWVLEPCVESCRHDVG